MQNFIIIKIYFPSVDVNILQSTEISVYIVIFPMKGVHYEQDKKIKIKIIPLE